MHKDRSNEGPRIEFQNIEGSRKECWLRSTSLQVFHNLLTQERARYVRGGDMFHLASQYKLYSLIRNMKHGTEIMKVLILMSFICPGLDINKTNYCDRKNIRNKYNKCYDLYMYLIFN